MTAPKERYHISHTSETRRTKPINNRVHLRTSPLLRLTRTPWKSPPPPPPPPQGEWALVGRHETCCTRCRVKNRGGGEEGVGHFRLRREKVRAEISQPAGRGQTICRGGAWTTPLGTWHNHNRNHNNITIMGFISQNDGGGGHLLLKYYCFAR